MAAMDSLDSNQAVLSVIRIHFYCDFMAQLIMSLIAKKKYLPGQIFVWGVLDCDFIDDVLHNGIIPQQGTHIYIDSIWR